MGSTIKFYIEPFEAQERFTKRSLELLQYFRGICLKKFKKNFLKFLIKKDFFFFARNGSRQLDKMLLNCPFFLFLRVSFQRYVIIQLHPDRFAPVYESSLVILQTHNTKTRPLWQSSHCWSLKRYKSSKIVASRYTNK